MPLAPQEVRTFFVSSVTHERKPIFRMVRFCALLLDLLRHDRALKRYELHEFVFMSNHIHLILTPAPNVSLEKAMQFVKGGFFFRAKQELKYEEEIWQKGNDDHRIKDAADYAQHVEYIWMNPVRAGLVARPEQYLYSSARLRNEVDPAPTHFQMARAVAKARR